MRRALLLGLTALALAAVGVASMADPALAAEPLAFPVCLEPERQEQADISGGEVVWTDYRNWGASNRDIYLFDLSTGRERTICTAQWSQCYPAISGDIIVWQDSRTSTSWDTRVLGRLRVQPCHRQGDGDLHGRWGSVVAGRFGQHGHLA